MNEDEIPQGGSDSDLEAQNTETPESDVWDNGLEPGEEDFADELPEEEEVPEAVEEVAAQPVPRPAYAPLNRPPSPALERLQATLDADTMNDLLAVIEERTQFGLQSFAMTSGRFAQVTQQEQEFASQYGSTMAEVIASMPPDQRANPDAIDQAASIAIYQRAKANGRSVIEEIKHFSSLSSTRTQPIAAPRKPTLTPAQRTPNGGQGARPTGTSLRRTESNSENYLKTVLGLSDAEAREWKGL